MAHVVDINNQTVQYVRVKYELILNGISYFEVVVDGADDTTRTNLDTGNQVDIYNGGTLKIQGDILDQQVLEGGGVFISGRGEEYEFTDYSCPVDSGKTTKTYTSTDDNTVFADLVSNATGWSSDVTGSTATTLQTFRVAESQTLWEGILSIIDVGNKDIEVDYSTKTLKLVDKKGTASAFRFTEGLNVAGVRRTKARAKASKVIVYGKGDGIFQIIGEAGSGTPVKKYYRPNIVDPDVANTLATALLARITQAGLTYTFEITNPTLELEAGDQGKLDAPTLGIEDTSIDIVKVTRRVTQDQLERLDVEVTNPELREASKMPQQSIYSMSRDNEIRTSSMQGSGNTLTWGNAINAKSGASMQIIFNIPASLVEDEAGDVRISSMTLDYDVDPYKKSVGTASFDGGDPQVQNNSDTTAPDVSGSSDNTAPGVSGSSSNTQPNVINSSESIAYGATVGSDSDSSVSCSSGTWTTLCSVRIDSSTSSSDELECEYQVEGVSGGADDIQISISNTNVFSSLPPSSSGIAGSYHDGFRDESFVAADGIACGPGGGSLEYVNLSVYPFTTSITLRGYLRVYKATHSHGAGTYDADNHDHGDGSYGADSHDHDDGTYTAANHSHADGTYEIDATDLNDISIGDDISDAASVNATSVNIYLDYWNGSAWVNKNTIASTGSTLDTDVDLTDSGTYPDAVGYWRVRIDTNSSSPDFVQGIVKIKHLLEN
jgi:hypothetical protein